MGYGDVRLSGVLGLYLGWAGWANVAVGLFGGFLVGGLAGIGFVLAGRRKLSGSIPYGPYMLVGAWIGLLAGGPIAAAYLRASGF
jgi:leader peptidase (prepilin peptidase) / N-methyltransferase